MNTGVPELAKIHVIWDYPTEINEWLQREKNCLNVDDVGYESYGFVIRSPCSCCLIACTNDIGVSSYCKNEKKT